MLFFFTSTRTRSSFEAGMAQLGGHAAFIDSTTTQISHGDTAKEIGEIYGPLLRRHRHPPVRLGHRQPVHQRRGRGQPCARAQHAVRRLSPLPDSGRPDDHHREGGRPARQDHQRQLGLCQQLPEAHLRAPEPDPADDALWHERAPDTPARIQAHARHRAAGPGQRHARSAAASRSWTTSTPASRTPTLSIPRVGARC